MTKGILRINFHLTGCSYQIQERQVQKSVQKWQRKKAITYYVKYKKGANAYDKIKSRKKIKHWHKKGIGFSYSTKHLNSSSKSPLKTDKNTRCDPEN